MVFCLRFCIIKRYEIIIFFYQFQKAFVLLVFIPSFITADILCPKSKTTCPEGSFCVVGFYSKHHYCRYFMSKKQNNLSRRQEML
ncbi:unnamed protein product [Larinioides sclopetarius]|uniref:Uncharacterized protein n=1 Tax=Larinioides sclopetarius TaxID=280406 RepID=A0AAV2B302_9ARAC